MYAYHARQLDQSNLNDKTQALDELKLKLRDKLPSKEEFITNFLELNYSSTYTKEKALVKYILSKYDSYYSSKNQSGTAINYDFMTIEHIHAENDTSKSIDISDIGRIGNLLLMEEGLNGKLGNKPFSLKHPVYLTSNIYLDNHIKGTNDWNKDSIINRTKMIAEKLFDEVFKI